MDVVKRLYRFRFDEVLPAELTLAQIRGREGVRVREAYAKASRDYGVAWTGWKYSRGDWDAADPVNRALSSGATVLYGICHSAIAAAGFSAGIGFIHTGKALAFVYDLADLYKVEVLVPSAFAAAAEGAGRPETVVRALLRKQCCEVRLMDRIMRDLAHLFDGAELPVGVDAEVLDREDAPAQLWGPEHAVDGGVNYGGDDT
jgi:CRISPR-associated protein Cas1